jgi:hypothetical protein
MNGYTVRLLGILIAPVVADAMFLYLPGDSGQKVEIAPAALAPPARILLDANSLAKATYLLDKQQIALTKAKDQLAVSDPDGNIILIEARDKATGLQLW